MKHTSEIILAASACLLLNAFAMATTTVVYNPKPLHALPLLAIGLALLLLSKRAHPIVGIGVSLAIGGGLSNYLSPYIWNGVPDYLQAGNYAYNAGDLFLVSGLMIVVISLFSGMRTFVRASVQRGRG